MEGHECRTRLLWTRQQDHVRPNIHAFAIRFTPQASNFTLTNFASSLTHPPSLDSGQKLQHPVSSIDRACVHALIFGLDQLYLLLYLQVELLVLCEEFSDAHPHRFLLWILSLVEDHRIDIAFNGLEDLVHIFFESVRIDLRDIVDRFGGFSCGGNEGIASVNVLDFVFEAVLHTILPAIATISLRLSIHVVQSGDEERIARRLRESEENIAQLYLKVLLVLSELGVHSRSMGLQEVV
jgi:hypothetical protein